MRKRSIASKKARNSFFKLIHALCSETEIHSIRRGRLSIFTSYGTIAIPCDRCCHLWIVLFNCCLPRLPVVSLEAVSTSDVSRDVSEGYSCVEGPLTLNDTAI